MKIAREFPDKWCVIPDELDCVSTAGEKVLADLQDDEFINCNTTANALLIAVAPEMRKAIEMFVEW